MKIRWWGVRGSVPVPGKDTVEYGGNTSCVSVEFDDRFVIFDSGTGIRECGNYLLSRGKAIKAAIFISHTHWDHIQGFPFFVPAYVPGNAFALCGPSSDVREQTIKQTMELQTKYEFFPVRISQLGAELTYVDAVDGDVTNDGLTVQCCRVNHPVVCFAYKLTHGGTTFVYGGDHEPYRNLYRDSGGGEDMDDDLMRELDREAEAQNRKVLEFCRGADVVSWDSQYTAEEYRTKIGWGHSWYEYNVDLARDAAVRHMVFSHHDPVKSDAQLSAHEEQYRDIAAGRGFKLSFAREGMEVEL